MTDFTVRGGGVRLSGTEAGEGVDTVLLHGLTATRDYVIHGSRALERAGHRVVRYDARGHGASAPAERYDYPALAADLLAVLDDRGMETAVLAGASMGAHTVVRFALDHPTRVRALVLITPAFDPDGLPATTTWERLAAGLRTGGVDGFVAANDLDGLPAAWRGPVERVIRRRMAAHASLDVLADAIEAVPRSRPFGSWADLATITVPTLVVATRDEADPSHPLRTAERYVAQLPQGRSVVEAQGESPLAWQGGRLARFIADAA